MTSSFRSETLGFIGLGAMGSPMVRHLATKLPPESRIWVYDVVENLLDDICVEYPEKVVKGESAKHVAQQVVSRLAKN
jgi:3-hydroxyisobutyrate dehydrogenase-like beta-hydroxyacid dehydrogenase